MSIQRVFLIILCTVLVTNGVAQHRLLKTTFNCRAAQGSAPELLQELVSYCGINIEFSPSLLDHTQRLTLTGGETTIGAVLTVILKGQRVAVMEKSGKIIIVAATVPLPPGALLEKYVLFGFIQQEGSLEPLPFASDAMIHAPKGESWDYPAVTTFAHVRFAENNTNCPLPRCRVRVRVFCA